MTSGTGTIIEREPVGSQRWFARDADRVVAAGNGNAERGLSAAEAVARPSRDGPDKIAKETPPSVRAVALQQLTGNQWLACTGLALLLPIVVEGSTWIRRRHNPPPAPVDPRSAVPPQRALPDPGVS